ncbi:MAG: polysaccharide biosynthesis tyrosine autokinase [Leucobacter sp.]
MELNDYWRIIRAHWLAIVIITLVGTAGGFGWAWLQPKVYTANASGIVATGTSSDLGSALAGDSFAKSRVKSYLDLATSRTVAEAAAKDLKLSESPDALVSRISVTNPVDTATLKVSADAATPEAARELAEAWVRAVSAQVEELENKNQGETVDPTTGEVTATASVVQFIPLDSAQLPKSPSSPNFKLATAIGFLVGLAVALGYALLRNIFDRRIHSIAEVERQTGVAVIGTVPFCSGFDKDHRLITSVGGNDRSERGAAEYAIAEALRELRTNLQFMDVDNPPKAMVVTSALPGEGKSTVTANLANAIAASGKRVIVLDGDLRRPMVAKTFGLPAGVGLTDVLIGRVGLSDVLQPWGSTGNLYVLGAGKIPPNPSELLGSKMMSDIIASLAEHAIVLIDGPPLLPVTDSAILAAHTDGALVVSYARRTTYDALKEALRNLTKVSGRPLGIILNGVPRRGVRADGYGYRYRSYSYYGSKAPEDDEPQAPQQTGPDDRGFKSFEALLDDKSASAQGAAAGTATPQPAQPRRARRAE